MMVRVDMFCAADDRHRVALLEELLQRAGQPVRLHAQPLATPSDPCLVACTARSLREPWIAELFGGGCSVVALRLDDTPLPGPCLRAIDMQTWPARSADRKVGALVTWLAGLDPATGGAAPAGVRAAQPAAASDAAEPDDRTRRLARRRSSDARRAAMVLGLLLVGGALLWTSAPERRPAGESRADAPEPAATAPDAVPEPATPPVTVSTAPATAAATAAPPTSVNASATAPVTTSAAASTVASTGAPAAVLPDPVPIGSAPPSSVAASGSDPAIAGERPSAADPVEALPAGARPADDALARLCRARSVAAAEAWAAALDWRQRRRAAREPCIARLLARPGYRPLGQRLGIH